MSKIIEDKIMMDEFEMEEIRNNIQLIESIRARSIDVANKEGRFVEKENFFSTLSAPSA